MFGKRFRPVTENDTRAENGCTRVTGTDFHSNPLGKNALDFDSFREILLECPEVLQFTPSRKVRRDSKSTIITLQQCLLVLQLAVFCFSSAVQLHKKHQAAAAEVHSAREQLQHYSRIGLRPHADLQTRVGSG